VEEQEIGLMNDRTVIATTTTTTTSHAGAHHQSNTAAAAPNPGHLSIASSTFLTRLATVHITLPRYYTHQQQQHTLNFSNVLSACPQWINPPKQVFPKCSRMHLRDVEKNTIAID